MRNPSHLESRTRSKRLRRPTALRLNGIEHWQKILDRLIWMLLRAGTDASSIRSSTQESLKRHRRTRALRLPSPTVLEYGRVLTFWRTEPEFLGEDGAPRPLPIKGRGPSFRSLAQRAVPGCDVADVLDVLRRHRLISIGRHDQVMLRAIAFLPRQAPRAHFVAFTLSALEGIIDTCHRNLTTEDPTDSIAHMQRVAMAERFDLQYLGDYDRFLREQATDFLLKQDAWLKRHEVKPHAIRKTRVAHVGVGVFGFRAR